MKDLQHVTDLIFDFDGVIGDTHDLIVASTAHVCRCHNIPHEHKPEYMGFDLRGLYRTLTGTDNVDHLMIAHEQFQTDNYHLVKLFDGAIPTLIGAQARRIRTSMVSNRKNALRGIIDHCMLTEFFPCTITRDDVTTGKPHPEGIQKVLAHYGVEPRNAVYIGDTPFDVAASKAAEVISVATDINGNRAELVEAKPDFIIHDLRDLLTLIRK